MSDTSQGDIGGPGAAPSSTPASTPSSTPSGGEAGGGQDFDFMTEVFGDAQSGDAAKGAVTEKVTTPEPAPRSEPAQVPAPAAAPVQAPPDAQTQPSGQQGSPTQQPETTKFDPADPISLARGLDENREAAIEHLATTAFKLDPTELEGLEVDIANTIPKLMAKTVVFAQTQFLTQLSRVVPLMIQRNNAIVKRNDENMGEFYSAWPSLDRVKHGAAVQELAVRFRQMFPSVTKEQMIEQLGPLVLTSQGLPVTPIHRGPAAASKPNGGQPRPGARSPAGFVPAAPGTVAQTTTVPEDPWAFMGPDQG